MGVKAKQASWPMVVLFVLALVLWLKDHKRDLTAVVGGEEAAAVEDGRYERIAGCVLVEHRQNDGDSFRVKLPDGRTEQIRLYFVDAPESAFRTYGGGRNNHGRIDDQAAAFGVVPARAVEVGLEAKKKVAGLLGDEPFVIHTMWDDPFGDRRFHAFVELPDGGWLHERLVEEGLVRIHTKGEDVPGGLRRDDQKRRLGELEDTARSERRGGWSR